MRPCLSFYETVAGGHDAWFDGALMLLAFLLAGRVLDAMMRDRARTGVDALLGQAAQGAMVVGDGRQRSHGSPRKNLQPGMVMRVAAGERLAADGEILTGASRFDQSLLTGESAPVPGAPGDIGAGRHAQSRCADRRARSARPGRIPRWPKSRG